MAGERSSWLNRFYNQNAGYADEPFKPAKIKYKLNLILFIATFITTMISGTAWSGHDPYQVLNWHYGIVYAILILTFLSAHEFGHYFASRYHNVDATLPFFLPTPFPEMFLFGTFGAVIKTRNMFPSRKALFDIGIAGPLAGFVVCIILLIVGFATLPPKEFIYTIHPQYLAEGGRIHTTGLYFGDTLIFNFLAGIFQNPHGWLPPMNEIYHYPFLCVGWFGLFVTTMNLLPLGQLDGGHVLYSLIGDKHIKIAKIIWWCILLISSGSLLNMLLEFLQTSDYTFSFYLTIQRNLTPILLSIKNAVPWYFDVWGGWIFWMLIIKFAIRLKHPPVYPDIKLDRVRTVLGIVAFIILIICLPWNGIYFR